MPKALFSYSTEPSYGDRRHLNIGVRHRGSKSYGHGTLLSYKTVDGLLIAADSISGDCEALMVSVLSRFNVRRIAILEKLHVEEQHRGKGIGSKLLEKFIQASKRHGAQVILVTAEPESDDKQADLIRFYTKAGFQANCKTDNVSYPNMLELHLVELRRSNKGPVDTMSAYMGGNV